MSLSIVNNKHNTLKKLIWIYFLLLIFEGALRKWVLPFLSTPLLLVRDPFAILIILKATNLRIKWANGYVFIACFITIITFCCTLLYGHQNLKAAIFGLRIIFFNFPLIFIIAKVFTLDDVIKIGRAMLVISIPMTLLIALQFYSPQSAWVNRGVGGNMEGGGFSGSLGYMRPPGTFSFTNGLVMFYSFCACFIFYFWFSKQKCPKWLLIIASITLIFAIPLCISRGLIASVLLTSFFALMMSLSSTVFFAKIVKIIFICIISISVLQFVPSFNIATKAITNRFEASAESSEGSFVQGSVGNRYLGGLFRAFSSSADAPIVAGNLGMGTNAGAAFITGSSSEFLVSEGEWGRLIGERGALFGLLLILLRIHLVLFMGVKSWISAMRRKPLAWLLFSVVSLSVFNGQWGQTTALGFSVTFAGFLLACFNNKQVNNFV